MLLLFASDFLFAFTVRKYSKNCIKCEDCKQYAYLLTLFDKAKKKFDCKNVSLLIEESNKVNAFAIGSLRKNIIILTTGLINNYRTGSVDDREFNFNMSGIIAHEMSHIINKDYFSGMFLIINEKALTTLSKMVFFFFNIIIKIISIIPFIGDTIASLIRSIYKVLDYLINFFYRFVVLKVYRFLQLQVSKQIEYRADKQAGLFIGGENMARALELLGSSSFFNIFSSHPKTQNRIKHVKNIKPTSKKYITSLLASRFYFLFSFLLLISVCVNCYKEAKPDILVRDFSTMCTKAQIKLQNVKVKITDKINEFLE